MKKIIIAVTLFCASHNINLALAVEDIFYELQKDDIQSILIYDLKNMKYSISVNLKEEAKIYFSKLTEKNIGRKLIIFYKDKILVQAIIKDKIPSGIIGIDNLENNEVMELLNSMLK
jgi:preprotein translocase subunit SecD